MQQDARPVVLAPDSMVIAEHVVGFGDLEAIRALELSSSTSHPTDLLRFCQVVLGVLVDRG